MTPTDLAIQLARKLIDNEMGPPQVFFGTRSCMDFEAGRDFNPQQSSEFRAAYRLEHKRLQQPETD